MTTTLGILMRKEIKLVERTGSYGSDLLRAGRMWIPRKALVGI